ncbi:MAG: GNAT family N-acetyltransferase [Candidatus Bathyarchaeota archaeon]|nr:GNAT family N-acetyltransferase [Candidatus Bathyarchaeota archaeon]
MVNIREAVLGDNDNLIKLQKKCPMGTDLQIELDGSPDFFNRSKAYEDWHILVAEDNDKIVGSAGYAVKDVVINERVEKTGYEYGFMVDPDHRRKGIASALQLEVEEQCVSKGVEFLHLNITEGNVPSMTLFTKLGFIEIRDCIPIMLMAYKHNKVDEYKIRRMKEGDIPVVISLMNKTYSNHNFYEPFTERSFREYYARMPFYDINDIFLYEDGDSVRAVAGYWDYNKVMKFTLKSLNNRWKLMSFLVKILSVISTMPKMPGKGEQMSNWYLTPFAYRDDNAAKQLLGYILNLALESDVNMITLPLDANDPIVQVLDAFRGNKGQFKWFVKPLGTKKIPGLSRNPLYIDVIDI